MVHKLNQLYFYLTEGCNLFCRHCWIQPKYQGEGKIYPSLDIELFKSIIKQAKELDLTGVKLTGGEPLLHPDIYAILDFIQNENLKLTIETNGLLCSPELSAKIALSKNPFVSVSIDGADNKTHEWIRGVAGSFDKAKWGLGNLVKAGLKPQVIITVMRRNKDQIKPLVRMAESLGAGSVKFNVVQPTARGERMHKEGETLSVRELVEIGRWIENELSKCTSLRLIYSHPLAFRPLGKMFGNNKDGCGICGILGILGVLADGSYALCGIGETVPELVFGRASRDRIEDVWNNTPLLNELREGLPKRLKGICGECLMKSRCLASCVAQNYYSNKDIWSEFWFCAEAKRMGFFPESRLSLKSAAVITS